MGRLRTLFGRLHTLFGRLRTLFGRLRTLRFLRTLPPTLRTLAFGRGVSRRQFCFQNWRWDQDFVFFCWQHLVLLFGVVGALLQWDRAIGTWRSLSGRLRAPFGLLHFCSPLPQCKNHGASNRQVWLLFGRMVISHRQSTGNPPTAHRQPTDNPSTIHRQPFGNPSTNRRQYSGRSWGDSRGLGQGWRFPNLSDMATRVLFFVPWALCACLCCLLFGCMRGEVGCLAAYAVRKAVWRLPALGKIPTANWALQSDVTPLTGPGASRANPANKHTGTQDSAHGSKHSKRIPRSRKRVNLQPI